MTGNKQVQCHVCLKMVRSDTLKRHSATNHDDVEKPGVREQLLIDNELYYKNIELGKFVFDMSREICED